MADEPLTDRQLREVVRIAVRRVIERIEAGEADGPDHDTTRVARSGGADGAVAGTPAGFVTPCAIPPPGSPRYQAVMEELKRRA